MVALAQSHPLSNQLKNFAPFWDTFPEDLRAQILIISKQAQCELALKMSSQSFHNFLSYPVHK